MTEQPERFLSTIQIAITLSGYFGSAAAATNFAGVIADGLIAIGLNVSRSALVAVGVVLVTIILSYITLIFGELVPKRLAMKNPEGVSLKLAGMLYAISQIFKPIVSLLSASVNGVLRLIGVDPHSEEDEYSEEEIRMMATAGSQKGSIGEDENEFIQNLFEFDDLTAEEFCTHRTQMSVLWARREHRGLGEGDILLPPLALSHLRGDHGPRGGRAGHQGLFRPARAQRGGGHEERRQGAVFRAGQHQGRHPS